MVTKGHIDLERELSLLERVYGYRRGNVTSKQKRPTRAENTFRRFKRHTEVKKARRSFKRHTAVDRGHTNVHTLFCFNRCDSDHEETQRSRRGKNSDTRKKKKKEQKEQKRSCEGTKSNLDKNKVMLTCLDFLMGNLFYTARYCPR